MKTSTARPLSQWFGGDQNWLIERVPGGTLFDFRAGDVSGSNIQLTRTPMDFRGEKLWERK